MAFIGEYTAKIDDKGRIVLPSDFRAPAPDGTPQRFVIRKEIYSPCLEMFTYEMWLETSEKLRKSLNMLNREHVVYWRRYMRGTFEVTPDPKLGRIAIPRDVLETIGATKEVVFCGESYKIEIWSKENFDKGELTDDQYIELSQELSVSI